MLNDKKGNLRSQSPPKKKKKEQSENEIIYLNTLVEDETNLFRKISSPDHIYQSIFNNVFDFDIEPKLIETANYN